MAATQFTNISDLKKQPTAKRKVAFGSGLGGLPQPMQAQMKKGPRPKVKFPHPKDK